MPHTPFSRFLGLAIVAAYGLALLWPDDRSYIWGWYAMMALPIVIGIFTWSTVRGAPPFEDNAFHRTLPPGDGHAFWRVLLLNLLIVIAIALCVLIYCWLFNFGWETATFGLAALTVPVWAWLTANGIAASLSTSRQRGRTWGYLAIFMVPVFSAAWLYWLRIGFVPDTKRWVYFTPLRTMALTGAFLYPLIWWLVAAKRRWTLGICFGMAVGALMPWLYTYGHFIDERSAGEEPVKQSSAEVVRLPINFDKQRKWLPVDELLEVRGLKKGEWMSIHGFWVNQKHMRILAVREGSETLDPRRDLGRGLVGLAESGAVVWGESALWNHLLEQLPTYDSFSIWQEEMNSPSRLSILSPGESIEISPSDGKRESSIFQQKVTEMEFSSQPWRLDWGYLFRIRELGKVSAATGGTLRLQEEGVVRVNPLQEEENRFSISLDYYTPDLWQADGPWWKRDGQAGYRWESPRVIAVDPAGKRAFALDGAWMGASDHEKVMLGRKLTWVLQVGNVTSRGEAERMELLRSCSLHVFWPEPVGWINREIPPPESPAGEQ